MGMRRMGSVQRKRARAKVRLRNGRRKLRERASRDRRVLAHVEGKSLPYEPWVMSWLSDRLGLRSRIITQADADHTFELARKDLAPAAS